VNHESSERSKWFENYCEALEKRSTFAGRDGGPYRCPCCDCKTLDERGGFDVCPVCFWEDDGQDDADADTVRGGPNGGLSLTIARRNYREFGACDRKFLQKVRKPTTEESQRVDY
jgi:hypothetical protein